MVALLNYEQMPTPARPQSVQGVEWPLVLAGPVAQMEVLQAQFRESERVAPEVMQSIQKRQIQLLAEHAHANSPFWRERLAAAGFGVDADWFSRLPVLTRGEIKTAGSGVFALPVPPGHGEIYEVITSGSTGTPMCVYKTELAQLFWRAMTLRDSLWHRRDIRGKLAAIRVGAWPETVDRWSDAYDGYACGPCSLFDARSDIEEQLDWLQAEQPQVLLTHPSNLRALAVRSIERRLTLPSLREVRAYSEQLPVDLRDVVREAWNVPLSDMYSANEVGYVALQCPESTVYHVLAESVLVEIIDDDGQPCGPGESGRVVVTSLHNFSTPLIRYELGDYATVGGPCQCGRTLPTIERVLGRVRNMMRLPGGRAAFPGFPLKALLRIPAIHELKIIQHSLEDLEIELVLDRPLTSEEEVALMRAVCTRLDYEFRIALTPVPEITRGTSYKREDFECRMT